MEEGYFVEHNGDFWQSVFPTDEAHRSALHHTVNDAIEYMVVDCEIDERKITVVRGD